MGFLMMFSLLSGDTIVAVDSPFGRLGLTVCYDLRFPELYQILRFKHQAQVVTHSNMLHTINMIDYIGCPPILESVEQMHIL
jgi:predicted amidohydrolase